MITISLDEQGVFENNTDASGDIVMIAGIVYDDKNDADDAKREKSRIRNYFEAVCNAKGAVYPQALHWGHGQNNKVRFVKEEYSKTLGEFLQNAKYQGKPVMSDDGVDRAGVYYVYALVKSRKGKPEFIKEDVSNLINENNASNLYMHMVEDTIARLLFYNLEFNDKEEVSLDLATRVYVGAVGEDVSAHEDIGYTTRTVGNGEIVYLTNKDVFRTALERDMLYEENAGDIHVNSLMARSINYDNPNVGHEFLYMADAVCTYLGFGNDYGTNKQYLKKVWDRMAKLTLDKRLLFSYDIVDTDYAKAWRNVSNGDMYNALSFAFDAFNAVSEAAAFYKEVWEKVLYDRIINEINISELADAIRKLTQYARTNNLCQKKLLYLYESLEMIVDKSGLDNTQTKEMLYDLYDVGVAAYNHVGHPQKAGECAEKCRQYSKFIGIERELRNRNKIAVRLCDSLQYKKAEQFVLPSYEYCKVTFETQKQLFGDEALYNSLEYGIVCSQLAQIYSYMRDERAEELFHKALGLMEKDSYDYYITESYLLHYYLQTKDKEKYEKYAKEYFGGNDDLEKQLEYLVDTGSQKHNPKIALKFAMFVYVKGIYTFYVSEISQSLMLKLADIKKTIGEINKDGLAQLNGHPWEITYKYLSKIAYQNKQFIEASNYQNKVEKFTDERGPMIDLIILMGEIEIGQLRSPLVNYNQKIEKAYEIIKQINPELTDIDTTLEAIYDIVTYTYC